MPDGIAVHLAAGQQLLLNLHLFNAGDETLTGTSGIAIEASPPVDPAHAAGVVLAGKTIGLTVATGVTTQDATCTTPAGQTLFAISPHMHLLGTHLKAEYNGVTLYDDDYAFDEQQFRMVTPTVTTANGKYHVTCTYTNYSGATGPFRRVHRPTRCASRSRSPIPHRSRSRAESSATGRALRRWSDASRTSDRSRPWSRSS